MRVRVSLVICYRTKYLYTDLWVVNGIQKDGKWENAKEKLIGTTRSGEGVV